MSQQQLQQYPEEHFSPAEGAQVTLVDAPPQLTPPQETPPPSSTSFGPLGPEPTLVVSSNVEAVTHQPLQSEEETVELTYQTLGANSSMVSTYSTPGGSTAVYNGGYPSSRSGYASNSPPTHVATPFYPDMISQMLPFPSQTTAVWTDSPVQNSYNFPSQTLDHTGYSTYSRDYGRGWGHAFEQPISANQYIDVTRHINPDMILPESSDIYSSNSTVSGQCVSCGVHASVLKKDVTSGHFVCTSCQYARTDPQRDILKSSSKRMATVKRTGMSCSNCQTRNTTLWRRSQTGEPVCNACGLYFKLHGQKRPLTMVKDGIQTRKRKPKNSNSSSRSRSTTASNDRTVSSSMFTQQISPQSQSPPELSSSLRNYPLSIHPNNVSRHVSSLMEQFHDSNAYSLGRRSPQSQSQGIYLSQSNIITINRQQNHPSP